MPRVMSNQCDILIIMYLSIYAIRYAILMQLSCYKTIVIINGSLMSRRSQLPWMTGVAGRATVEYGEIERASHNCLIEPVNGHISRNLNGTRLQSTRLEQRPIYGK